MSASKDRERDRSPSPVLPTVKQIVDFHDEEEARENESLRRWLRADVWPVLSNLKQYRVGTEYVKTTILIRKPTIPFEESVVRRVLLPELERKMPEFTVDHLGFDDAGDFIELEMSAPCQS